MGFKTVNSNIVFPALYPRAERKDPTISDNGWDRVEGFTLRDKVDYMPQKNLQENICACESNLIFMCGSMGMGKTFAMDLAALYGIDKVSFSGVMISVRAMDSKKGSSMLKDAIEVCGKFAGCEINTSDVPTLYWPQYNSSYRLVHSNFNADNPTEWDDFKDYAKKIQASYIAIDEATQIKQFKMFTYWFGRNRDASGMTPQMILSFNPEHDHWTTQMLRDGGYLGDDWYLRPEMNGVTRYFYIKGDTPESVIWGDTPEEVASLADIQLSEKDKEVGVTINQIVKSFTMFTGETADNKKLVAATKGQMLGNLHAVGGTQRSIVKGAYFGPVDNEEINVNRRMIHSLWENPICGNPNERYATLDVSRSVSEKSDDSPLVIWHGLRIVKIIMLHVDLKTLVATIHRILNEEKVPIENFAFDGGGIGEYLQDFTEGNPIKGNRSVIQEYDKYGNPFELERYYDLRSQLHGKMEAMLRRNEISCDVGKQTQLKYGKNGGTRALIDILFDEINVFTTIDKNGKIYYRNKKEYKQKFKSSPDLMDAIVMRSFFELDARPKKQPKPIVSDSVYRNWVHPPKIVNPWKGRFR